MHGRVFLLKFSASSLTNFVLTADEILWPLMKRLFCSLTARIKTCKNHMWTYTNKLRQDLPFLKQTFYHSPTNTGFVCVCGRLDGEAFQAVKENNYKNNIYQHSFSSSLFTVFSSICSVSVFFPAPSSSEKQQPVFSLSTAVTFRLDRLLPVKSTHSGQSGRFFPSLLIRILDLWGLCLHPRRALTVWTSYLT